MFWYLVWAQSCWRKMADQCYPRHKCMITQSMVRVLFCPCAITLKEVINTTVAWSHMPWIFVWSAIFQFCSWILRMTFWPKLYIAIWVLMDPYSCVEHIFPRLRAFWSHSEGEDYFVTDGSLWFGIIALHKVKSRICLDGCYILFNIVLYCIILYCFNG